MSRHAWSKDETGTYKENTVLPMPAYVIGLRSPGGEGGGGGLKESSLGVFGGIRYKRHPRKELSILLVALEDFRVHLPPYRISGISPLPDRSLFQALILN